MRPLSEIDVLLNGWEDNATEPRYSREIQTTSPILGGTFTVGVAF